MNLHLNINLANAYKSTSQVARVITESWVENEGYCPCCGNMINKYLNNKPVADFFCNKCLEDFELKSKKGKFGLKIVSGQYDKMINRISSLQNPNFFFMGYDILNNIVLNFFVVPKYFFNIDIVEKRKPLSSDARRSGWIGSNILFSKIPKAGQIFYVKDGKEILKKDVLASWSKTVFLKQIKKTQSKGWILDVMNCIDFINKKIFTIDDLYSFEKELSVMYPHNKNIKPKIRQQLQFLRNKGYLTFLKKGHYQLT